MAPTQQLVGKLRSHGWFEDEIRDATEYLVEDGAWRGTTSPDLARELATSLVWVHLDRDLDCETIAQGVEYVLDYLERPGGWPRKDRYELLLALAGNNRFDSLTLLRLILKARRLMRVLDHYS